MKWLNSLKTLLSVQQTSEPSESMNALAFRFGVDRRQHRRVKLPEDFANLNFPHFHCMQLTFPIGDLSLGGACILDTENLLSAPVGEDVELMWTWGNQNKLIPSRLVGVSYNKKHLQFLNLDPVLLVEIQSFIKAGIWGQKMKKSALADHAHIESPVSELWVGIDGTNLSFLDSPEHFALLEGPRFSVDFYKGSLPLFKSTGPRAGEVLPEKLRMELLLFLFNFPYFSPRLQNLLAHWKSEELRQYAEAG